MKTNTVSDLVTRGPTRETQWLSSQVVARLALAIFQDAIVERGYDWCSVINSALSISLVFALGCRVGDVARDPLQKDV